MTIDSKQYSKKSFWSDHLFSDNEQNTVPIIRSRRVVPSVLEVPSSILDDSNVFTDFSLICVAVALNTHKMEH